MSVHYITLRFYRLANSATTVNLVLVKVNRCLGLKVLKMESNRGTVNWLSCWLLLAILLALDISGASST